MLEVEAEANYLLQEASREMDEARAHRCTQCWRRDERRKRHDPIGFRL